MEKIFTLKFNLFNDSIEKSVRKGEYSYWLELLFDNESYKVTFNDYYEDNCHCTKKIEVDVPATGKVTLGCIFHFTSSSSTYHYILPRQVIDINVNNEYTLNMYYYRYDSNDISGFDFGPGDIPKRPEKKGCYVATCVYGSYDCPQVWTLRRFRDDKLSATWYGRLFIKVYYAISPTLVKCFGKTKLFKNIFKPKLDKLVAKLNNEGVADTPYDDKI